MFCDQCAQTAHGTGCTKVGVCGKNEDIESLQKNLIYTLKGISAYVYHARELGAKDAEIDAFIPEALYLLHDEAVLGKLVREVLAALMELREGDWALLSKLTKEPGKQAQIMKIGKLLMDHKDASLEQVMSALLKEWWPDLTKPAIEKALRKLAYRQQVEFTSTW